MKISNFKKFIASFLVTTLVLTSIPQVDVFASGMTYTPNDFGLTLTQTSASNGKVNYDLDWDPVKFTYNDDGSIPTTRYYVARKKVLPAGVDGKYDNQGEYAWELRGNYTDEGVKVLNIYPNAGDGLQSWMNSLNSSTEANGFDVNIQVDKQSLSSFNSNPTQYLKKEADGSYNYDVVVFGFWDSNNHVDLASSSSTAYKHIDDYIKSGYGVIFGHDTIQMQDNSRNPNFTKLLTENSEFYVVPRDQSGWHYSEKIGVKQQSSLTTYPFDIYGKELIIPMTHNVNQLATEASQVYMTFEKNFYPHPGDGPYYNYNVNGAKDTVVYEKSSGKYVLAEDVNFTDTSKYLPANSYLMKDGNVAFIQCGHSSGKTSTTEQMILANTIYSLKQMVKGTHSIDQALDTERPDAPSVNYSTTSKTAFNFTADDNGSEYLYRTIAAPVGLSIYNEWDNIKQIIGNSSTDSYTYPDKRMVAFSTLESTGEVKAELKTTGTYEYYIDNNPIGEKRDSESGTKLLNINDTFNIPTLAEGLNKDSYLHIWSYDNANNLSVERTLGDGNYTSNSGVSYNILNGITNVKLWDAYPKYPVSVKYTDDQGNDISNLVSNKPTFEDQLLGSTFTPPIATIDNYRYKESTPSTSVVVSNDETANVVTHVYEPIISKDIYIVTHKDNTVETKYTTVKGTATDTFNLYLPEVYNNYEYGGFSKETSTSPRDTTNILSSDGNEYNITIEDTKPLYLHYDAQVASVNLTVKDTAGNVFAKISKTGYVGDKIAIPSSQIKIAVKSDANNLPLSGTHAYTNYKDLNHTITVNLTEEKTYEETIILQPRRKPVRYEGIEFDNNGGYIGRKELDVVDFEFAYTDDTETNYVKDVYKDFAGWNYISGNNHKSIDFRNAAPFVTTLLYYKGVPPTQTYNVDVYYKENIPNGTLLDSEQLHDKSILDPAVIDIKHFDDYELNRIEVLQYEDNSQNPVHTYTYTNPTDNIYAHMPELNPNATTSGSAIVYSKYETNLYYTPYTTVTYKEYLSDTNRINPPTLINECDYSVLLNEQVILDRSYTSSEAEIEKVVIDGVEQPNPSSFDFSVTANTMNKTIEVYYRPLTYDLNVVARSNGSDNYTLYTYTDIPISHSTVFKVPEVANYTFTGATTTAPGTVTQVVSNKYSFTPNGNEGEYTVYLDYGHDAKLIVTYELLHYDAQGKIKNEVKTFTENVFVGSDYTINIPEAANYSLEIAYLDGTRYNLTEGNSYTFKITNTLEHAYLVYVPNPNPVTLIANPNGAGTFNGYTQDVTTDFLHDNNYAPGAKVTIDASANQGYSFINWTSSDVTIVEPTSNSTSFIMPNKAVTVTANFRSNSVVVTPDPWEPTEPEEPEEPEEPVEPSKPEKPIKPVTPVEPELPITDPSHPGYWDFVRMYDPYIHGYPTGLVEPSSKITRAEVLSALYNLFGEGYVPNQSSVSKFTDVKQDVWYSNAIAYATDFDIVNGYEDGTLRPNDEISRAELIAILARYADSEGVEIKKAHFTDSETVAWAQDSIDLLYSLGMLGGYEDGTVRPKKTTSRAEFVTLVNRLIKRPLTFDEDITFPDLPQTHWAYNDMMNAANGGVVTDDIISEATKNYSEK